MKNTRKEIFETPEMTVLFADGSEVTTITTSSIDFNYETGDYDID